MTGLVESLYCAKCGQGQESKLHVEARLGQHKFVPAVSLESVLARDAKLNETVGKLGYLIVEGKLDKALRLKIEIQKVLLRGEKT